MNEYNIIELKHVVLINLFMGFYNIYLYVEGDWLFNLIIGGLNIGVWVFNRNK
jgi:hypothetical protein